MDADMVAMFPNGIRALMIDDDTKFLKSATALLSVLNFDVVRCSSSVAYALKSLTSGNLVAFDVILVHAANAAACGFDFRAIVEADLLIPVIYFLEEDHEATGDEADELLRTLQAAGSYVIKKPLDVDEVRTRLWTVIAFRKCDLEAKASRGGGQAGLGVGGEDDEGRVHFKVVTKGRGRKRKGSSSKQGRQPPGKGKEKENNMGRQRQQQNDGGANNAQKSGSGEAYNLSKPNTTMTKPSDLFMQSVLRMHVAPTDNPKFCTNATVPSYNPMFFSNAAGPSSNAAAFGNTITTTSGAPAAALRTLYSTVARQQQHPWAHNNVIFGNIAPSAAAPTMAAAAYELPQYSQGIISNKQQEEDAHALLMFGPFLYQGPTPPPPPVAHQDSFNNYSPRSSFVVPEDRQVLGMVSNLHELTTMAGCALGSNNVVSLAAPHQDLGAAPNGGGSSNTAPFMAPQDPGAARGGDNGGQQQQDVLPQLMFGPFPYQGSPEQDMAALAAVIGDLLPGGMAGGDTGAGGSSSAAATEAGAYGNDVSLSFLQPPNIIAEQDGDDELAGLMLPQHISDDASGKAKMLLFSDDFNGDCNGGSSLVALDDQAPGMGLASNLNELTALAGGAFGSSCNDTAAMEGDDYAGLTLAMLPSDQYEDDDTSFPLQALLGGLHGPMLEFNVADLDAIPDGGAGTSLVAREGGGSENGLDNLAGIDIPHDVMQLNDFQFPQPQNKNNVRE